MARLFKSLGTVLTIAAGQLPAQGDSHEAWWSGDDGIGGAQPLSVKASLSCAGHGDGQLDTVVEAYVPGSEGNNLRLVLTGRVADGLGVLITSATVGTAPPITTITISFERAVTTVLQVETAIAAQLFGGSGSGAITPAYLDVKTPGTPTNVLDTGSAFTSQALTGGVSSEGHNVSGSHLDLAIFRFSASAWGAITAVELVVARSLSAKLGGEWATVEPFLPDSAIIGKYVASSSGLVTIKDTIVAGKMVAIPCLVPGGQRVRFGLRAADANSAAAFACTADVEIIQQYMYA